MSKHYQIIKSKVGLSEDYNSERTDDKSNEVYKLLHPRSINTLQNVLMDHRGGQSPSLFSTKKSAYGRYRQTQKDFFKKCSLRKNFKNGKEIILHQRNLKSTKTMRFRKSRKSEYINSTSGSRAY